MTVKKTKDTMTASLAKLQDQIDDIPQEAWEYFRSITPKRSGYARRRTILNHREIQLRYAYGERLDKGYSRQARKGMSGPTLRYLKSRKRTLVRK